MIVRSRSRMLRWSRRSLLFRGRGTVAAARSPAPSGAASARHAPRRLGEALEGVSIELHARPGRLGTARARGRYELQFVLDELAADGRDSAGSAGRNSK